MTYDEALNSCIFKYISGSHAYGSNRPDSDIDVRGVFIAPLKSFFNIYSSEDAEGDIKGNVSTVHSTESDEELQELRKFLKLSTECNPNIIEFLYVDRLILHESPIWKKIRDNRHLFLSKKAKFTFSGYAIAQLKRIKNHRGYLLNPPTHKPTREEFGLPESSVIPPEQRRGILSISDEFVRDEVKELIKKESAFTAANNEYRSYMDWDTNRNPYRKELERIHGRDTKHTFHLIRLLTMAKEILVTGEVNVFRSDVDEMQDFACNAKFEAIETWAEGMDKELNEQYEKSTLQHSADKKKISELYIEICEETYGIKL